MQRNSDTIVSLHDIQVGDEVAFQPSSSWRHNPLRRATVTKTTATQIVIDRARFKRDSGTEIGASRYHKGIVYALGVKTWQQSNETWAQRAAREQVEYAENQRRDALINHIRNLGKYQFDEFSIDVLEQAAKLLGYDVPVAEAQEEATT